MKNRFRSAAPLALALCAALPLTARADDASKCKFIEFAKLPVVMEDDRASIAVTINGKPPRLWLDSGAEMNFMSKAKAVELGLKTEALPMGSLMEGIGGTYRPEVAQVRDFYGILGTHLPNVRFVVGGNDAGNGFIGASMLGLFDSEFDLAKGAVNWFV